ncbi:MAG TPA: hypothetical protein VNX46_16455 [Candidatus Acidoferrum sp.]|jgi:hypothetical protein|nr:hypothetical protein [Candidatus Acidoferrum sp.]
MKFAVLFGLLAVPFFLASCASPPPPQAFHNKDSTALVIDSLDDNTCEVIKPTPMGKQTSTQILKVARKFPQHQTAVVILENYNEPQPGSQFRSRATPLFISLRGAGYEHIVFLQGKGVNDPEGLIELVSYD